MTTKELEDFIKAFKEDGYETAQTDQPGFIRLKKPDKQFSLYILNPDEKQN